VKIIYRRQKQQTLFAALLGLLAAINLLFFLILYRPVRSEYYQLQESIERLQREVQVRQQSVQRLEKLSAQLETSEQDRQRLILSHFIAREAGFSEILTKLEAMAQSAGVRKTRVNYSIGLPQYGLYSVKIGMPVTASYPNIANFIKSIEHSDTFFIIDRIDIRGNSDVTSAATVSLDLSLETFFYQ
jgi:Tfp pilus assembly protein PilO